MCNMRCYFIPFLRGIALLDHSQPRREGADLLEPAAKGPAISSSPLLHTVQVDSPRDIRPRTVIQRVDANPGQHVAVREVEQIHKSQTLSRTSLKNSPDQETVYERTLPPMYFCFARIFSYTSSFVSRIASCSATTASSVFWPNNLPSHRHSSARVHKRTAGEQGYARQEHPLPYNFGRKWGEV